MRFSFVFSLLSCLFLTGVVSAHPNHDHFHDHDSSLPEEPDHLYIPADQSDIFAIPLDMSEREDEEELDHLEQMQKREQTSH